MIFITANQNHYNYFFLYFLIISQSYKLFQSFTSEVSTWSVRNLHTIPLCTHLHTCLYVCVFVCVCVCMCLCVYVCVCTCVYMCMCWCVFVCMCVYMFVCMCVCEFSRLWTDFIWWQTGLIFKTPKQVKQCLFWTGNSYSIL